MKNDLKQKNEYYLDKSTSKVLSGNKDYVKKCIKRWGASQIDYATCKIDDDMIEFLISLGYTLSSFSSDKIRGNRDYVKLFIEAYGGNQLDFANCELDKELIDFACSYDFMVDASNMDNYTNVNLDKYFNSFLEGKTASYKEKIKSIKDKTGSFVVYCLKDNVLLNEKILNEFSAELIVRCIKYLYLLGYDIKLEVLLQNNNMNYFKFIFTDILGMSFDDISINQFYEMVNNYSLYNDLVMNIMKSEVKITDEVRNKLMVLFKNKDNRIIVKELNDLDNISNLVIDENKKAIESNDIDLLRNSIYLTSFNISYMEVQKLINEFKINSLKIATLTKSIKDEKIKSTLSNYQALFEIIEFIEKCEDIEVLKAILNQININLSKDSNYFKESHDVFYNIIDNIKYFYGVEIFEKMSVDNSMVKQKVETLEAPDGKKVQYYNISSNKYYFQHTLNAYGTGGKLSDFKNSKLVGKAYICLSLIDNNHKGVKRIPRSIDNVTLLFDKLSPSSLCVFSEEDMRSEAKTNSRDVQYYYSNFDTVENILKKTKRYNEYVYYREDNDGNFIYPSGILVTGDRPEKAEIEAAAYLGVPLIKLNPTRKKGRQSNINSSELNKKEEIIRELKEMKEYLTTLDVSNDEILDEDIKKSRR